VLQSCDVPQFCPEQDCKEAQLIGQGLKFDLAPDCSVPGAWYTHPDAIIGEYADKVGNSDAHKPGCQI